MKAFMSLGLAVIAVALAFAVSVAQGAPASTTAASNTDQYQQWIADMKTNERGPFARLRWFCSDGTVHPPKPYPCAERGGGHQHGEWSAQTKQLRERGYKIANVLAGLDAEAAIGAPDFPDSYSQLLIEKFLVGSDDGWILRRALFYRGALQEEDEREGARTLLLALIANPEWIGPRYPALRVGAQMLPHGASSASVQKVRQVSAALSERDRAFQPLRAKIHGAPDAGDAQSVRDYAAGVQDAELKPKYEDLAAEIDKIYRSGPLSAVLRKNADVFGRGPWLQKLLRDAADAYDADSSAQNRYVVSARLLADLRDALPRIKSASARLRVLDLSLQVEGENFRASAELREQLSGTTRHQRTAWLKAAADAAYGTGALNGRQRDELAGSLQRLGADSLPLGKYLDELRYLGRAPGWGTAGQRFLFYEAMLKLAEIEPLALLFIQDQLRGSPLLFYSQTLDTLLRDGNRLAGVKHKLFGEEIGVGFSALNPGLTRGTLHANPDLLQLEEFRSDGIYLLPETVSDLPPVAGILTAGEGNPLSHVQLLARNLGIPNVAVSESLLPKLRAHDSERVVMAVSAAGLVELAPDGPPWNQYLGDSSKAGAGAAGQDVVIRPDLEKLDLSVNELVDLNDLRASDSGKTVGPKAAKLGELRHHYPQAVARGAAIPFGVFRKVVLEQPYKNSGNTVFEWMVAQYRHMESMPEGSPEREKFTDAFRAELYDIIVNTDPGDAFRKQLRAAMKAAFGDENHGVFIRSDTNVEDLPGFTGAGLNLTLPNVVGFDNVLEGVSRVWASPFTARAFAWRQSHMEQPEHVYTSILLLESVASDKSGVLVTQDLDTGDRNILSVAVNEGVGGAVDGQAAESLRIDTRDGSVRVMATATAPWRRLPSPRGGVDKLPASGSETVLQPAEIQQLIELAKELPQRFPAITDDQGKPAPADIEFGFVDGELRLFQLRPFLESRKARGSAYLTKMDQALAGQLDRPVNMKEVPAS